LPKIPDGAQTNYTYTYLPNTQTVTVGTRWTKTTLDGFGRTTTVETGITGQGASLVTDTEYAACACSPLGKMKWTSRPHAPGGAKLWTTYAYDGRGPTLSVALPDGSTTTYVYEGNTTKVTDPADHWKKQTTDAMGNLIVVTEPDPQQTGAEWTTSYIYDVMNHLTDVDMPRPDPATGTFHQRRKFEYAPGFNLGGYASIGPDMWRETNPETGTITYEYNSAHRVVTRTDAKNQQRQYSYDAYGRVTQARRYVLSNGQLQEQLEQRVDYHYDSNPLDGPYSQNAWGRVTAVEFRNEIAGRPEKFSYQYSYNQAGRVTNQRMRVTPGADQLGVIRPFNLEAAYGWDNEGRMTSLTGPSDGPLESYTYDALGRPTSGGATYNDAGQLWTFNGVTRSYNSLGQVTRMTAPGTMDVEYRYTAGQNNGRIASVKDYITGEDVSYQYDSLNRLVHAETVDAAWGTTYTYDGWGNLTNKRRTKGTPPELAINYDPALNMQAGSPLPSVVPQYYSLNFDVEDRPLNGYATMWKALQNAPEAGRVTYDPSGKKVFWLAEFPDPQGDEPQAKCEINFYGITGQKLAAYTCTYDQRIEGGGNGGHFNLQLPPLRTQHIGGALTNSNGGAVTADRLGSIRAKGTERYTYYPYGEAKTATVPGGGMYAGLESPAREYLPDGGRFDRPDPLGLGAVNLGEPGSWNRFAYVQGDPVNYTDPEGLLSTPTCGNGLITDANGQQRTINSFFTSGSDESLLALLVYGESNAKIAGTDASFNEKMLIGATAVNRYLVVNGYLQLIDEGSGKTLPAPAWWGVADGTLDSIIGAGGGSQYASFRVNDGHLVFNQQSRLTRDLNGGVGEQGCENLLESLLVAHALAQDLHSHAAILWRDAATDEGWLITSFNSRKRPSKSNLEHSLPNIDLPTPNHFYGIPQQLVKWVPAP
jgi:RHS repeat-associated protein